MIVTCNQCKKEFDKAKKAITQQLKKGHSNHYCSKACSLQHQREFQRNGTVEGCYNCGKPVYRSKEKLERSKSGRRFCCNKCASISLGKEMRGANHPSYIDGQGKYREIAYEKWGTACVICGYDRVINVHHIDKNRKNNDISNLIVLCPNHHAEAHRGLLKVSSTAP